MNVLAFTGTEGHEVEIESQMVLLNKHSIFRLHFGKRGLKLKKLTITYDKSLDDFKFGE